MKKDDFLELSSQWHEPAMVLHDRERLYYTKKIDGHLRLVQLSRFRMIVYIVSS